jgi:ABC-type bacteriocin/lantibiotic exporter with double-glycine peptidase domain
MRSFLSPVRDLVQMAGVVQEVAGDLARIDDVLAFPRGEQPPWGARLTTAPVAPRLVGAVELRDVTFGYNPRERPLVEGLSLTIPAGTRVAIVGASGSGKSTVAKLVSGLYEPWSGSILFDGKARAEIPAAVMAHSLAFADQDVVLFAGTVRDNLSLWDATLPDADLVQRVPPASTM